MESVNLTLPDGSSREAAKGSTVGEFAYSIGNRLGKDAIAGKLNGDLVDLSTAIEEDASIEIITVKSEEGLEIYRHSSSHIMAQAVQELYGDAHVTIGPVIDNGFYYDFDFDGQFTPEDFEKIEAKMAQIVKRDLPIEREIVSKDEAVRLFEKMGESYKVELINSVADDKVSLYRQGEWVDLCRGPHLPSTGKAGVFKLLSVAGAYWRGDESKPMLQRIYATAFSTEKELKAYLNRLEEAKKRDHRRVGKDLDLFEINEEAGAGMVIYHPKGAMLKYLLEEFERKEHIKRGYHIVQGPQLLRTDLWKKSGHYENYRENMYFTDVEGIGYGVKPMNCLAHMIIYASRVRSYRDLPLRYFELGTVHRHEKSGVLHGLLRVRGFTQDDAHLLCTPEQLNDEIRGVIEFISHIMDIFGFPYKMEVSTRPEKSIGSDEDWERATGALMKTLDDLGLEYDLNEGDGAFYGPKIDVKLRDCLEREWQCATIQCDFTLPERFDLSYIGKDGEKHRPVMIHRVILGSIERFIGILTEHFAGAFPTWLAPVQAVIINITDKQMDYAKEVEEKLRSEGMRVEGDYRNEKLGFKIREAQLQKIPYMIVIGDKEVEGGTISPRSRSGESLSAMTPQSFVDLLKKECNISI
ncbi:MAG: threonine--tRNA ligase [Deltaproteobacteria bacterium]|nr:threonine--tRNA ligase [Deltaproteobacteria bacterium]